MKILIGMLVSFLGLKFTKMSFFWVSLNWGHFFGVEKIAVIFLGSLKICIIFGLLLYFLYFYFFKHGSPVSPKGLLFRGPWQTIKK